MDEKTINQYGNKSFYIERNEGNIYFSNYVENDTTAFKNGSYELIDYTPSIKPAIPREEVCMIQEWIDEDVTADKYPRLALLYGKAGIGKSIVMHDLQNKLQNREDYIVLGLKSDQVEFIDTEDLRQKLHLTQRIDIVVRKMTEQYRRVILLIDQIDALSLSLSSNRTPLRSLLKLLNQIKLIPHVRIVISCRPYDLEYDPMLSKLQIKNKWELKEFMPEQVSDILEKNNCNYRISDNLLRFLGNPLNLYLFIKIWSNSQLTDPLSTDLLYNELWRKYITNESERKVNKEHLLALLDSLVEIMYERQELSVHVSEFETNYTAELKYLFTNGLLLLTKNGQIQFFHQTLFDYVYARRFIEHGHNLLEGLRRQHQGLFSRAAVKSIMTFLREQNPSGYIHVLDQLLYAKKEDDTDWYRYHLKSLALSNMAYFDSPLTEEIQLISRKIFVDQMYMNVIFETIHTENWFKKIWEVINKKGGWRKMSPEYKDKIILMCQRMLWTDAGIILDTVEKYFDYGEEEDCKYIGNLLQYYDLNCDSDQLISFYRKLVKTTNSIEYTNLLRNILKGDPDFVCQELKENIKSQLLEKKQIGLHRVNISHDVEVLYEELLEKHHDHAIQLLVDILTIVYSSTKIKIPGSEISNSSEFFGFHRVNGGKLSLNFTEDAANIIIDDLLKNIETKNAKNYIQNFSKSEHEGFVFIALFVYTSFPDQFKDDIHDIIVKRSVLANAPCWVEFQALEALGASFSLMTDDQKKSILRKILEIQDEGERNKLSNDFIEMRLQYGHPFMDIDLHKGKALEVIPLKVLRKYSWVAYQERLRIDRKFKEARMKNEQPNKVYSSYGWTSLKEEQGFKMSCKTWLKSMHKYKADHVEWDKPSLTGQCNLFRKVVSSDPDKYIDLIDDAIDSSDIPIAYSLAGMQGLIDAKRINSAEHVLMAIMDVENNDVNSTERGFSIHSLLFALSDIVKGDYVPDSVLDLLCNALLNTDEPSEHAPKEKKDIYNVGINQARGNAGYMLVECAQYGKHKEEIFKTIESIAETASVYTRSAILLNMATLNLLDQDRNVILFKKLMHDYDPRLMSMPIHNYNPLVYFVNYAVDELMDFFGHAADCPECYKEQVIILWLAWSHNNKDERIKVLLDKMCDSSEVARISLMNFISTLNNQINEDAINYILHFMEPKFDSPEMGKTCDQVFYNMEVWPEDMQMRIVEAYVTSPLSKNTVKSFIEYLAGYAIKEPVQTLKWLEQILNGKIPDDYYTCNHIIDIIIQSYNGIKSFNDNEYQDTLEHAMDLLDQIMQNPNKKYLISNFINKLDNE